MKVMKFYNLRSKEFFETTDYTIEIKQTSKRPVYIAKTKDKEGRIVCKIVSEATYKENLN
jgi:hypothetical protein